MNPQPHIQILRAHLLAMSRVSQRALDYSVKGYQLPDVDFARHAGTAGDEIEKRDRRIKELSRSAVNEGIANASDFRFAFAALSIATALRSTYLAATEIAGNTMRLFEDNQSGGNRIKRSATLERKGHSVNAAMRLCIVALFERDACHARTVLSNQERSVGLFELDNCDSHSDRRADPQRDFERTIARGLEEVAKQTHDIADALLFWLQGNPTTSAVAMDNIPHLSRELVSTHPVEDSTLYVQSRRDLNQKASQSFSC
jgi:hypothetical protein